MISKSNRRQRTASVAALAASVVVMGTLVPTVFSRPAGAALTSVPSAYLGRMVPTKVITSKPAAQPTITPLATPQSQLPSPGAYNLALPTNTSTWQAAGSTGIRVAPAVAPVGHQRVAKMQVQVLDAAAVRSLGLSGLVLRLTRTDKISGTAPVQLQIPRSLLNGLYGAEYTSRLHWVQLPGNVTASQLNRGTVRPTSLGYASPGNGPSTVAPQIAGQSVLVAAAGGSTSSNGSGTWAATSLRSTSSWQVSNQTGDFTWSYPLRVPPASAGPVPNLSLNYSSGSIDGLTASTNNQSSVVGEGWQLNGTGFIERSYIPCAKDGTNLPTEQAQSGDLCWNHNDLSISFAGHSGTLVALDGPGTGTGTGISTNFRIEGDDGSRVTYLPTSSTCNDGGHDQGCWRLTTQDGTSYYFGRNATSAWTVPVYGDDATDECYHATATTFAGSVCTQAWRWNLDMVQDLHGNTEKFTYKTEQNYYHRDRGSLVSYIRGGYLTEIDYGMPSATAAVTEKVVFNYDKWGRCSAASKAASTCGDQSGTAFPTPPVPANYPDVPWDQNCVSGGTCTDLNGPSFWTTQMLDSISTYSTVSSTATIADTWTLSHQFYPSGDAMSSSMSLAKISHGSLPDTIFADDTYHNRVMDQTGTGLSKRRLTQITLDTGGKVTVTYATPDCTPTLVATLNPATNTHQCFPQWWTVPGTTTEQLDWFNKYAVAQVSTDSSMGAAGDDGTVTYYTYQNPAWRLDRSPATLDAHRTWSDFAGYATVEVRVGDPASPTTQLSTDYRFFQGMDGDADGSGSTRAVSLSAGGHSTTDSRWFAGRTLETVVHANGGGIGTTGDVLTDDVSIPWALASTPAMSRDESYPNPNPNATAQDPKTYSITQSFTAHLTGDGSTYATSTQADGSKKTVTTTNQFDSYGRTTQSQMTTPDAGSTCSTTTWDGLDSVWLLDLPGRVTKVGVACDAQIDYSKDVISDARYIYDNSTTTGPPVLTVGDLVRRDVAKDYTNGVPNWIGTLTTPKANYDSQGRPLVANDAYGGVTTTTYTPLTGGPVTSVKTSKTASGLPALATTTSYNPLWGLPTAITDANSNLTTAAYDALGRLTSVWMPDRPFATGNTAHTGTASIGYTYTVGTMPMAIRTTRLNSTGGTYNSYVYVDGLGRQIQTQDPMDGEAPTTGAHQVSGTTVTDTFYNYAGAVSSTNNPYGSPNTPGAGYLSPSTSTQPPSATSYQYDGAGRKTADIAMGSNAGTSGFGELWRTSYSYGGTNLVSVTPPAGGTPTATTTNSLSRTTWLDQYLGATTAAASQRTSYSYDARGDLTAMSDQANNQWTWRFDARGLQTGRSDPDTGITINQYTNGGLMSDTASGLTSDTDPGGNRLHFDYDAYGRKVDEKEGSSTGNVVADWQYDATTTAKGLGLLTRSRSYVTTPSAVAGTYARSIGAYNALGQPLSATLSVPDWNASTSDTAFTWSYAYDQAGNQSGVTDPAMGGLRQETVGTTYDLLNNLTAVAGTAQYLGDVSYTTINQPSIMTFSNGSSTVTRTFTYDDKTSRVTDVVSAVGNVANPNFARHHYTYDAVGLLTSDSNAADGLSTDTQCYNYDALQELTDVWTPARNACGTGPQISNIGGPAPYWTSYGYDQVTGNRTSLTNYATNVVGTDTQTTYGYGSSTSTQPHTLTSTVTSSRAQGGSGWTQVGTANYGFDTSGDTTSRPGGQALSWNAEGKLDHTSIGANTTQNVYDADGSLLRQVDPAAGDTLLLGDTELRVPANSTTPIAVRTYVAAGMPVAERSTTQSSPTTSKLSWLNPSALGQNTVNDEVDATTKTVTHRYFDPFGNSRGSGAACTSSHSFLNAPLNSTTSTVHLGARDYDPATGRFLSADPLLSTTDPQQANGYTYADSNPVTKSDPSGLFVEADGGGLDCTTVGIDACNANAKQNAIDSCEDHDEIAQYCGTDVGYLDIDNGGCAPIDPICLGRQVAHGFVQAAKGAAEGIGSAVAPNPQTAQALGSQAGTDSSQGVSNLSAGVNGIENLLLLLGGPETDELALLDDGLAGVAARSTPKAVADAAKACVGPNSFTASTPVMMANGSEQPISRVRVGDKILASDPQTGETASEPVTAIIRHTNRHTMADVTLSDGSELQATSGHPIWDATQGAFVAASKLVVGDRLLSVDATILLVRSVHLYAIETTAYNLEVSSIHTYYAGNTPVLVHNSCFSWDVDSLAASGADKSPGNPGFTRAGRALTKHGGQSVFPVAKGSVAKINADGLFQLEDIITSPSVKIVDITAGQFQGGKYFILPDSRGAAFDSNGTFQYFGKFKY